MTKLKQLMKMLMKMLYENDISATSPAVVPVVETISVLLSNRPVDVGDVCLALKSLNSPTRKR